MGLCKIRPRAGTKEQWETANPILAEREIGFELPDTGVGTGTVKMKMGDGVTAWTELPYADEGGGVSGDYLTPDDIVNDAETDDPKKVASASALYNLKNDIGESLTNENSETFNFGVKDGVRGFFTDPSRADDSFIPFRRDFEFFQTGAGNTFNLNKGESYLIFMSCYNHNTAVQKEKVNCNVELLHNIINGLNAMKVFKVTNVGSQASITFYAYTVVAILTI